MTDGRTDGQTDGRTDGQNYDSQDRASIARAVKTPLTPLVAAIVVVVVVVLFVVVAAESMDVQQRLLLKTNLVYCRGYHFNRKLTKVKIG